MSLKTISLSLSLSLSLSQFFTLAMDFSVVSKSEAEVGEAMEKDPTGRYIQVWDSQSLFAVCLPRKLVAKGRILSFSLYGHFGNFDNWVIGWVGIYP